MGYHLKDHGSHWQEYLFISGASSTTPDPEIILYLWLGRRAKHLLLG